MARRGQQLGLLVACKKRLQLILTFDLRQLVQARLDRCLKRAELDAGRRRLGAQPRGGAGAGIAATAALRTAVEVVKNRRATR